MRRYEFFGLDLFEGKAWVGTCWSRISRGVLVVGMVWFGLGQGDEVLGYGSDDTHFFERGVSLRAR